MTSDSRVVSIKTKRCLKQKSNLLQEQQQRIDKILSFKNRTKCFLTFKLANVRGKGPFPLRNEKAAITTFWFAQKQEAQLSQRDRSTLRVIEYFANSLKITQGHSKWHCCVGRVYVPISISMTPCLYVVPFLRYLASKNGVTLKLGVGVIQGHWKWRCSIYHIRLSIGLP